MRRRRETCWRGGCSRSRDMWSELSVGTASSQLGINQHIWM